MALAGLLHDLGKLAERADMPVQDREALEINKQLYCSHPESHLNGTGSFSHVHAAYTPLAMDTIESFLPPVRGGVADPFQEWGEARAGGAEDSLINAAAKHHRPDTFLQWIVATAAHAATGLDRKTYDACKSAQSENPTSGGTGYAARQHTLFEQIDIGQGGSDRPASSGDHRYRLEPLSPKSIFPVRAGDYETEDRDDARAEYTKLWNGFTEALERIPPSHRRNLPLWLDHFDTLWMTFTQAVPASIASGTIPDMSLYDHSRVVAAIAAALWRYHHERGDDRDEVRPRLADRQDWDEAKLLFVQGDLFGIQDFIFASGGETTKRAAKLLRGRSFFVALLTECAALRVLDVLSLPPTSQIVNAAGKFQIIAPNTDDTIEKLREVRENLDEWFLHHTFGQSGIGIAWTPATCNDLQQGSRQDSPYRQLFERLFGALEDAKHRRFDLCGQSPPATFDGYLDRVGKHGLCSVDGRSPADGKALDGHGMSRLAQDQMHIGDLLTKDNRNRLLVTRRPLHGSNVESLEVDLFGLRIGFTSDEEASGRFGAEAASGNLLRVWDFSLPKERAAPMFRGYARRDVNAWVPRFDETDLKNDSRYKGIAPADSQARKAGDLKPFHEIACEARERVARTGKHRPGSEGWLGTAALMTLKGDVDNLGAIFQRGLPAPSLSRMAALSRQMNAFFSVHLPYLCRTEFRDTYTVFAGGDDFFLVGPWAQQMDLAERLREDFHRYVACNARIGFSAGLAMTKPGLPVRRLEAMAEDSLEDAKAFRTEAGDTKNAVTCFGRTVGWRRYRELLEARECLQTLAGDLSHGYVHRLLSLVDLAGSVESRPENAIWRSRFYYHTSRALERLRGLDRSERRQRMEVLAKAIVQQGIERFEGDYRIALFGHLYRNRT